MRAGQEISLEEARRFHEELARQRTVSSAGSWLWMVVRCALCSVRRSESGRACSMPSRAWVRRLNQRDYSVKLAGRFVVDLLARTRKNCAGGAAWIGYE